MLKKLLKTLLAVVLTVSIVGCSPSKKIDYTEKGTIMTGTQYETPYYLFDTEIEGPTIMIIGGVHGIEIAGWGTALDMLHYEFRKGKVLVLPQINILADKLEMRYPGHSYDNVTYDERGIGFAEYEGVIYTDLNREFPGISKENGGTVTQQIAYETTELAKSYDVDYVIDMHESKETMKAGTGDVGDTVIYAEYKTDSYNYRTQGAKIANLMVDKFNETCLKEGEQPFQAVGGATKGSVADKMTQVLNIPAFTFETNRKVGVNTYERRVEQQKQLLEIFFKHVWEEEILSY